MAKFRKRPVVIEAFQMTPERRFGDHSQEWPVWLREALHKEWPTPGAVAPLMLEDTDGMDRLQIATLEGNMVVEWGDWIIQGVKGELYPCKPDIFTATYEPVE